MAEEEKSIEIELQQDQDVVIADMNIEGMPWHLPGKPTYEVSKDTLPPLTRRETFRLTLNAMAASLLIALIFIGCFYLFIQFCIHIWF